MRSPPGAPSPAATAADTSQSPQGVASPAVVTRARLDKDPLKADFRNFQHKVWVELFGQAPTPLMYDMGHYLQHGPDKSILMGFRGAAKSYTTVTYAVWSLFCDPTGIVLTVSGSDQGAKGNAALAWSFINRFDWLAHMKPRGTLRMSAQAFDVQGTRSEKSESFAAMSLFGQLTGRRASLIIPDDVETPNTSATEGDRSLLRLRYAELGGAILKPKGLIKVLGTAQTEQTLYSELALEKGYAMRMWPVTYPTADPDPKKDEVRKYGAWLAPMVAQALLQNPELAGTPVEPTRFDEADLFDRRQEYGATEYDRQFKLFLDAGVANDKALKLRDIPVIEIAVPSPGNPLKVPSTLQWSPTPANAWADIQVSALNGDSTVYAPMSVEGWMEPERKIIEVDPSGDGLDETSWEVLAQHLGRVFLCKAQARLEGFSKTTMEAIAADAKLYGVHEVRIEKNYGGGMFGELLRPHLMAIGHPCAITEEVAGQVQKEVRIVDTLQGIISDHRLVIAAEVLRQDFKVAYPSIEQAKLINYRLTYQLTRITKRRGCLAHDDRIDTLASGVASFIGTLKRQLDAASRQSKEDALALESEKIIEARRRMGLPLFGLEPAPSRLGNFIKNPGGLHKSPLFTGRRR